MCWMAAVLVLAILGRRALEYDVTEKHRNKILQKVVIAEQGEKFWDDWCIRNDEGKKVRLVMVCDGWR